MTNEEKIISILQEFGVLPKNYNNFELEYTKNHKEWEMLIKLAEWKDKEFLSIIEDKLNYARDMIKENHDKSVRLKYEGMRKILIEIKNELKAK